MQKTNLIDTIITEMHEGDGKKGESRIKAFEKKIDQRAELTELVKDKIKSILIPGKDTFTVETPNPYTGEIDHSTYLTKQGAMKIMDLFGLVADFHIENDKVNTPRGPSFVYEVRCDLKNPEGQVLGVGYGIASSHAFGSANVAIKMARKSALVDAVIYAVKLDFSPDEDHEKFKEPQYEYTSSPEQTSQGSHERISPEQVQQIVSAAEAAGMDVGRVLAYYGINSLSELTVEQAEELMNYFSQVMAQQQPVSTDNQGAEGVVHQ